MKDHDISVAVENCDGSGKYTSFYMAYHNGELAKLTNDVTSAAIEASKTSDSPSYINPNSYYEAVVNRDPKNDAIIQLVFCLVKGNHNSANASNDKNTGNTAGSNTEINTGHTDKPDIPKKNITITYDANGGHGAPKAHTVKQGESCIIDSTMPFKSMTQEQYTVKLNTEGGILPSGTKDTITVQPKTTYVFSSWNTNRTGNGRSYTGSSSYTGKSDITLYAQYTPTIENADVALPTPTRDGYEFQGWFTGPGISGAKVENHLTVSKNMTVYARWNKIITITYDANGGTGAPAAKTGISGCTISSEKPIKTDTKKDYTITLKTNGGSLPQGMKPTISAPVKTGYTFDSWNTKKDGTGTVYHSGDVYRRDESLTLYAQYKPVVKDNSIDLPAPGRSGYKFLGWYVSDTASTKSDTNLTINVTGDMTLYAKWQGTTALQSGSEFNKRLTSLAGTKGAVKHIIFQKSAPSVYTATCALDTETASYVKGSKGNYTAYWDAGTGTMHIVTPEKPALNANSSKMFQGFTNLEDIVGMNAAYGWDASDAIDLSDFCSGDITLKSIDLTDLNTSAVSHYQTLTDRMFFKCTNLTEIKGLETLNMKTVRSAANMFSECAKVTTLNISGWDTRNLASTSAMFYKCINLSKIYGIEDLNVSKVTNMGSMFSQCNSLQTLNLSNWNTSAVTTLGGMFFNCTKLSEIKGISHFDVSKVTNMQTVFSSCPELTTLDLTGWDTGSATTMNAMFYNCKKLSEIKGISRFNVSKVKDMSGMFRRCSILESLDLSGWNTSSVAKTDGMFAADTSLKNIFVSDGWDVSKVTTSKQMFERDALLPNIIAGETDKAHAHTGANGYLTYKSL